MTESRNVREFLIEIDGEEYPWNRRTITVPGLRELAGIPAGVEMLELDVNNHARRLAEDELITQPGLVRFVSTRRELSALGRTHLPRHWLLEGVPAHELQPLLGAAREMHLLAGDVLFREGDETDGLYLITSGMIRVSTTGEGGETLLATVPAGDVLGEMGVLDGQSRSGTATAVEDTTAYFLPSEPFLDVLESSTAVCLRVLVLLTNRLRASNGRLGELRATQVIAGSQYQGQVEV
jgi:CRP-like cAMP-binding protein